MKRLLILFFLAAAFAAHAQEPVNLTYSPDSSKYAYTLDNDLYVHYVASGRTVRLTEDGSEVILNGYASWVYYEEIFGRPSRYRAFWWSPDSRKIAFYRFDDSKVPMFPIYSPEGQDGSIRRTHYPKVSEPNPEVRVAIVDLDKAKVRGGTVRSKDIVWADFNPRDDQYLGTPFWGPDSRKLFVQRMPRIQHELDLFAVDATDGSKESVYHETWPTWVNWIEGMLFDEGGLYFVRDGETLWQQIYYLSYDGRTFRRLTDGENWRVNLLKRNPSNGDIYFTAERDSRVRSALYKLSSGGTVTAVTPVEFHVMTAEVSDDCSHVRAVLSNSTTPYFLWADGVYSLPEKDTVNALPQIVTIPADDGLPLYGSITYPKDFDPSRKYPVHAEIYGGPDIPYVYDRWQMPRERNQWFGNNGIISIVIDVRASGHNGRRGVDLIYKDLTTVPVADAVTWAKWLGSLPYVDAEHIGIEGFSFGGSMTELLLFRHSDLYCCGIGGGGVTRWELYDSHYTERFMSTWEDNRDGYESASVVPHAGEYPGDGSVMLRLTHGTGDDNVHFQNTLQLVKALQEEGKQFELMIYPDGMHGYRGAQGDHSWEADKVFWKKYLLNE